MHERIKGARTGLSAILVWLLASPGMSWALELPAGPLENLKSEVFLKREGAQAELLAWAHTHAEPARDALYQHSRVAAEPEVRKRCLAVLRELVVDEYLKEGEGYLGIRTLDEFANIPGDPKPRSVIRVIQIIPDSAAQQAGLLLNDLIAALDDQVWYKTQVSLAFTGKIRQFKPNTRITLTVLREGKLLELRVTLGRRPLNADTLFFDPRQIDLESAEKAAKDGYFRRWLEGRKSRQ